MSLAVGIGTIRTATSAWPCWCSWLGHPNPGSRSSDPVYFRSGRLLTQSIFHVNRKSCQIKDIKVTKALLWFDLMYKILFDFYGEMWQTATAASMLANHSKHFSPGRCQRTWSHTAWALDKLAASVANLLIYTLYTHYISTYISTYIYICIYIYMYIYIYVS